MAIYKVEQGQLVWVANDLEHIVGADWQDEDDSNDEFFGRLGFGKYDEVLDVYTMYRRWEKGGQEEMAGARWMFDVNIDGDNFDLILVDSLPGYLTVMSMLEPVVNHVLRQQGRPPLPERR
ncbi:hypothetical protein [Pseudomonas sp. OIL-1]|uniref:hypothetical protein n=1 Tax=Pseudomonas sp. OIL-1 TaxID=2706126 RepID=UPI0013A78C62|nr:hypothetical protein [Pseudomonas sp. OIL-1]QIB50311.1 hypothetical protein G3M63_04020 [Pseudomonas sp. OIL-1]